MGNKSEKWKLTNCCQRCILQLLNSVRFYFRTKFALKAVKEWQKGIVLALLVSGEVLTKFTRNCDEMLTAAGRSLRLYDGDLRGDLLTVLVLGI